MEKHVKPDYSNAIRKIQNEENSTKQMVVTSTSKFQGKNSRGGEKSIN